jgi:uncharacterized membrane protein
MAAVYASSVLFIALVTAEFVYVKSRSTLSQATVVAFENGSATISTASLEKGTMERYATRLDGVTTRFVLYRKPDGAVAAVFDACTICGSAGYFVSAEGLICKNCAAPINPESVGTAGGCNPIPIAAAISGDAVTITQTQIAAGEAYFKEQ